MRRTSTGAYTATMLLAAGQPAKVYLRGAWLFDCGVTLDVPVEAAEDLTDATEALAAYNFGAVG